MLPSLLDIKSTLAGLGGEHTWLAREVSLFKEEKNKENRESHVPAMVRAIHNIYTGLEDILKDVDNMFGPQREEFLGKKTLAYLDVIRSFCLDAKNAYSSSIQLDKVLGITSLALKVYDFFVDDIERFMNTPGASLYDVKKRKSSRKKALEETGDFIEITKRKLRSYRNNYENGNFGECVPALFFALESMTRYVLSTKGLCGKTHEDVRALLARHFINSGEVDKTIYGYLNSLYLRRKNADFNGALSFNKNDVDEYVGWVRHSFELLAVPVYMDNRDLEALLAFLSDVGRS